MRAKLDRSLELADRLLDPAYPDTIAISAGDIAGMTIAETTVIPPSRSGLLKLLVFGPEFGGKGEFAPAERMSEVKMRN